jgi:hypothetical protein
MRFALTLALLIATPASLFADDANLLKPTNKAESWQFEQQQGGEGAAKVEEEAIVFNVTKSTGTNWHVQAYMTGLDLKEGQTYQVTFEAKAVKPMAVGLNAGIGEEDWHQIGLSEEVYIGKEFRKYSYKFTAQGVRKDKNRIGFSLGSQVGTLYVKNMTLIAK